MPIPVRIRPVVAVILLVILGLFIGRAVLQYGQRGVDFQWDAAHLLLAGQNPYTATMNQEVVETQLLPVSALYFPSALALLTPYALMPYALARWAWLLSNIGFTAGIVLLLFPLFRGRSGEWPELVMMGFLFVSSAPWAIGMGIGQHALFSVFFFLLAMWCSQHERQGWAGVALAVASFKYLLIALPILYFVNLKQYRAVGIAVGIHATLHLWLSYWLGESPLALILQPLALSRLTHPLGGYLDLMALQRYLEYIIPGAVHDLWWGIGSLLLLGVIGGVTLFKETRNGVLLLTTLCWLTLIPFYHPHYDLVVLVIPLFLLLYRKAAFDPMTRGMGLLGIGAIFYLNRLTTIAIVVLPPVGAAVTARFMLFVLFGIYYAVAIRLLWVIATSNVQDENHPLFKSSQGGA